MKTLNLILLAGACAGTLGLASNAAAQFKINENDGIAASPKVRQMLNERKAMSEAIAPVAATAASASPVSQKGIAASPKVQAMLAAQKPATAPATTAVAWTSAGYKPTGEDGITASPKLRQQLNERGTSFMVAPVK